jgi:CubicO group peptidase (beta-lactamase class C family)
MTSGLEWDENITYLDPKNSEIQMDRSTDPIGFILSRPMAAEPGTQWNYNGGNPQLLGEILWKATGMKLDKFAQMNLFTPLGIKKFEWLSQIKDMPSAAWGLRLRSRDLAKFGLLYMNNGKWYNNQILDDYWAKQSLSPWSQDQRKKILIRVMGIYFGRIIL